MMVKVLSHGSGSCATAINYLLNPNDHTGEAREDVKVLRGDPATVAKIADGLPYQNRYSSMVIGFAPEDRPTEKQIEALIKDTETLLKGGLGDAVALTAVQHTGHGGRIDIHVIVAKVDLESGKAYNPLPPGWQKTYGPLRDMHNLINGWSRPDDIARARLLQPGKTAMFEKTSLKETLHSDIMKKVEAGFINDRSDIEKYLTKTMGATITRGNGKDYIGLEIKGVKIRLKGELYGKQWTREKLLNEGIRASSANQKQESTGPAQDRSDAKAEAREIRERLSAQHKRVCEYNNGIYRKPKQQNEKANIGADNVAVLDDSNILNIRNSHPNDSNHSKIDKKAEWQKAWQAELQRQKVERQTLFKEHIAKGRSRNGRAETVLAYMQKKATMEEAQKLQRDMHFKKAKTETINNAFDIRNYKAHGNNIFDKAGNAVAKVHGGSVIITKTDPESILASLKVYQSMNGKAVRLRGNKEFKKKCIAVMLENNIPIKNTDRSTMKLYASMVESRKKIDELNKDGISANLLYLKMFEPFPSEYVEKVLKNSKLIIDVESNMTGQAAKVIRMNTGIGINNFILKYNGRHMTLDEVIKSTKRIMNKELEMAVLENGS
jgi:hypothetical protein